MAIITGATGGIGSATARRFAAEGVAGDATDAGTAAACVARATERYGGLDTLFANAGIEGKVAPLAAQTRADFERVLAINVLGPWMFLRAAALGPYVASKHAVIGLARAAAIELGPSKIRVNTVNPGPIDNRMMSSIDEMAAPGGGPARKVDFE